MLERKSGIILAILIINVNLLLFSVSASNIQDPLYLNSLRNDGKQILDKSSPHFSSFVPILDNQVDLQETEADIGIENNKLRFSLQQQSFTILNESLDIHNESFEFIYDIWADVLGSGSFEKTLYEDGVIDTRYSAGSIPGASLFTRIGNHGINKTADSSVGGSVENISAGWRVEFPVPVDYEVINISFKWRFDTPDAAFDNKNALDPTSDYQEIRCRISNSANPNSSFWIGNDSTPNKTVFYRVGPNVINDEIWHNFKSSFQVPQSATNYTLELGAYLNTRENWNEYFDAWIDDILIIGFTDLTDNNPPQPYDSGLSRTQNKSKFLFWVDFYEGKWESGLKNITVFYNQTSTLYDFSSNKSLENVNFQIDNAGYNHSRWEKEVEVDFNDTISYFFLIFDNANNSFQTALNSTVIWDFVPPEIVGTDPVSLNSSAFVYQFGNGTIFISINISDWGFGVKDVILNYSINGAPMSSINMIEGVSYGNGVINYYIKLENIVYKSKVDFCFYLEDEVSNSRIYPSSLIYSMLADVDTIKPIISPDNFVIEPSTTLEGHTNVTVIVTDSFGEIDTVKLSVTSGNGTIIYQNISLTNSSVPSLFVLRKMQGIKALKLPYDPTDTPYNLTVYAHDKAGKSSSFSKNYIVPDILAPKVERLSEKEYLIPGRLKITVQVTDFGSGVDKVYLERKIGNSWGSFIEMDKSTTNPYLYSVTIETDLFGNQLIEFRIHATDNVGNELAEPQRRIDRYYTRIFFATTAGLIATEVLTVIIILSIFSGIRLAQRRRLKIVRRARFDVALRRSERLAYLGEEAMFGFIAAYGQREGVSSILVWEPRMIGNFYQFLKELTEKGNNTVSFVMKTKPQNIVTFVDFKIEEIGCSAITYAYPVSTLPQKWLSTLTLDQVPTGAGQGVLLLMLLMRDKWSETSYDFKEEIADGMTDLKDLILAGEDKELILDKVREFRLFISGTVEVLDEIDTDVDEISDDIMDEFESAFIDTDTTEEDSEPTTDDEDLDNSSSKIIKDFEKEFLDSSDEESFDDNEKLDL